MLSDGESEEIALDRIEKTDVQALSSQKMLFHIPFQGLDLSRPTLLLSSSKKRDLLNPVPQFSIPVFSAIVLADYRNAMQCNAHAV